MRPGRSSLDLLAAIALALIALAAALIPLEAWLRVVLVTPLVLVVSGYAMLCALLSAPRLPAGERAVYAVALSVTVTTLGGIVVQLFGGLDRTAWAVLLSVLTIAAALVALRRRREEELGRSNGAAGSKGSTRLALPRIGSVLAIGAAIGLAVWSIGISSAGARRERDAYVFTALWAQPTQPASGAGAAIRVGVDNQQGETSRFRLVVEQGGRGMGSWTLVLLDGGRWRRRIPVQPIFADPVLVTLYRDGHIYRRVSLASGSGE